MELTPGAVVARAPGRVNLIGEHLDYNGGRCLPIALPQGTTATALRATGRGVKITSGRRSWSGSLGDRPSGWAAYVTGVLAALEVDHGVEITIESDLAVGAGLSSSAALECSVALAVNELFGLGQDREALMAACIRAENEFVGVPTGGMDQAASLFSHPGAALMLDFGTGERHLVPFLPEADGYTILVVDTRVSHDLASGEYAARRAQCSAAAAELGLPNLAAARVDDLGRLSNEQSLRRARHVVSEQYRVLAFVAAAQLGDWTGAGELMTASHVSLRDDFEVSCPELDLVVATALGAGASGARMTGGGFGGSAVVLTPVDQLAAVQSQVAAAFAGHATDAPTLFRVEASGQAQLLVGST